MGFWTRDETELLITISAGAPHDAMAETNWAYYATRLERCAGFATTVDQTVTRKSGTGRFIRGSVDLGVYNWLWLRRQMTTEAQERFDAEAAELTFTSEAVDYSPDAGERQTVFLVERCEPYWITIETDAAIWLQRLGDHPYAVCVSEQHDRKGDWVGRKFRFPRHLLTIRKSKPTHEITDERREELRAQLARARKAA